MDHRKLKRINPKSVVISGGGLATSNPGLLLCRTGVDMVVTGEGEHTLIEICRSIKEGRRYIHGIPGTVYRIDHDCYCVPGRSVIDDLDAVPYPAWDLLPMEIYLSNPIWGDIAGNSSGFRRDVIVRRSMNIISSRGCPFSCNYCYHLFGRSNYRFRSAGNVLKEIELLVDRYQVDFIGFVDDNMMANEKRLLEFCDLMQEKRLPVAWGCHGRVTSAKPHILERMADTGCVWIGYGIESGSQRILDLMNKKATVTMAKQAIADTRNAGIFANTTFIYGYPGETRETMQETVNFKRALDIQCGSFFATPYPGTPLYESIKEKIADEEAFISSLGNATDFSINLTDFPDDVFLDLKAKMDQNMDIC